MSRTPSAIARALLPDLSVLTRRLPDGRVAMPMTSVR